MSGSGSSASPSGARSWLSGMVGSLFNRSATEDTAKTERDSVPPVSRKRKVMDDRLEKSVFDESTSEGADRVKRRFKEDVAFGTPRPTDLRSKEKQTPSSLNTSLSSKTRAIFEKLSSMDSLIDSKHGPNLFTKRSVEKSSLPLSTSNTSASRSGPVKRMLNISRMESRPSTTKMESKSPYWRHPPTKGSHVVQREKPDRRSKSPSKMLEELCPEKVEDNGSPLPMRPAMQPFKLDSKVEAPVKGSDGHSIRKTAESNNKFHAKWDDLQEIDSGNKKDELKSVPLNSTNALIPGFLNNVDLNNLAFTFAPPVERGPEYRGDETFSPPVERGPRLVRTEEEESSHSEGSEDLPSKSDEVTSKKSILKAPAKEDIELFSVSKKTIESTVPSNPAKLCALTTPKWSCSGCFVQNEESLDKCACCGQAKPGTAPTAASSSAFGNNTFTPTASASGGFQFGVGSSSGDSKPKSPTKTAPLFGLTQPSTVESSERSAAEAEAPAAAAPTQAAASAKWSCSGCFVQNDSSAEKCLCCGQLKSGAAPSSTASSNAFGSKLFQPTPAASTDSSAKPSKWSCSGCFVQNESSADKCLCCGQLKPGAAPSASSSGGSSNAFGSKLFKPAVTASDSSFKFGFGASTTTNQAAKPEESTSQQVSTDSAKTEDTAKKPLFGTPAEASKTAPSFGFGSTSTAPTSDSAAAPVPEKKPLFGFGSTASSSSTASSDAPPSGLFSAAPPKETSSAAPSTGFLFGASATTTAPVASSAPSSGFLFGSSATTTSVASSTSSIPTPSTGFAFGSTASTAAPSAPSGLFNITTNDTSADKPATVAGNTAPNSTGGLFSFGSSSAAPSAGFAFGSKPAETAPAAPVFGSTATSQAPLFGSSAAPSFGTAPAPAAPTGTFSFGASASNGSSAAGAPPSGLFAGFGNSTAPAASQPAVSSAASTGFAFGSAAPAFNFPSASGQPANPAPFGAAPFNPPAPSNNGFAFGAAPSIPQSGFNFGADLPSTFNFGGGSAQPGQFGASTHTSTPTARKIVQARRRRK